MRKVYSLVIVFAIFSFLAFILMEKEVENSYYFAYEEKIPLINIEGQFVVRYGQMMESVNETEMLVKSFPDIENIVWKDDRTAVISFSSHKNRSIIEEELLKNEFVNTVQPLYKVESGAEMIITDEIVIRVPEHNLDKVEKLHEKHQLTVLETNKIFQRLRVPRGGDALQIANTYQESGLVRFSHPDFIALIQPSQAIPNDTYFNNQFYLRNTGQVFNPAENHAGTPGADINILGAWDITHGDNNVIIAVLDQGVTSNHPDLPNTRQLRLNGSNFLGGNPDDPSPFGDNFHGDACAGIVAATRNNGEGISGVAPGTQIMPVRMLGTGNTSSTTASAIVFAADNGAHIISNSYVVNNATNPNHFPNVVDAIQYAITHGRDELGSILVCGAGNKARHDQNNPGIVEFPSNVRIPGVFTVGASDRNDLQANYSPTSNPNSPNNQIINIVAPSSRAIPPAFGNTEYNEIWTMDIPGNPGGNPSKFEIGNIPAGEELPDTGPNFLAYTGRFGGTSAATPQIAGIAALILSVNPNLTQMEVYNIITRTAEKVGGYNYTNGVSNELGHGRANACLAVQIANTSISGPDYLCSSTSFTLQDPPQGATVSWTATPANLFTNDSDLGTTANTGPASVHNRGFGTITFHIETDCGEVEIPKTVWVGTPSFTNPTVNGDPYITGSCHGVCPGFHQAEVTIGGIPDAVPPDVNWQLSGGPVSWSWDHFTSRITFEVQPMTPFPFSFNGTATNPCGSTPFTFCFISGPNCPLSSYVLSPNPADEEVTVTNLAAKDGEPSPEVEIHIISQAFESVLSLKAQGPKISVPTGHLPNGQYILQISDENGVYRKHLIIRHQ